MTRYTAVIVEDEPLSRARLRQLLAVVPWLTLIAEASDGEGGAELINRLGPDVAFLDIAMAGSNGIDLARELLSPPLIVYTTAFTEHAVAAFAVGAVDYLVKPFGRRRLGIALGRIRRALEGPTRAPPLEQLLIRQGSAVTVVPVRDVVRIEGRDDFAAVYTASARHLAGLRLADLEQQLPATSFVRIHRSHIVNLAAVKSIAPDGSGRLVLTMTDGATVRSSRARAAALRRRFS